LKFFARPSYIFVWLLLDNSHFFLIDHPTFLVARPKQRQFPLSEESGLTSRSSSSSSSSSSSQQQQQQQQQPSPPVQLQQQQLQTAMVTVPGAGGTCICYSLHTFYWPRVQTRVIRKYSSSYLHRFIFSYR
jgi:hypothetical protein